MKTYFLSLFLCLLACPVLAQVSVSAQVDMPQASLEDEVTLTVTVKGAMKAQEPVLPSIPAFKVIPSGTSSSLQIINGNVDSSKEYHYVLIPQQEGQFTIDPISVSVEGKDYKSNPITLAISKSGNGLPQTASPQNPNAIPQPTNPFGIVVPPVSPPVNEPKDSRDFWMTATVSKNNPYVNEEILYTFRFFTRIQVGTANLTLPDFKEFWSEEVVPEKKYYKEIGGDRFVVSEKVIALYPLQSGQVTIPETVLKMEIPEQAANPFFNDPFFRINTGRTKAKNLRSDPIVLNVKPLPENHPKDDSNLVGQFSMQTSLSQKELKAGETATLTIEISGKGNIKDAVLPDLPLDRDFKVYNDKPATDLTHAETGIQGKKVFKKALVPQKTGDLTIPAFTLSYFDPGTQKFETLSSPAYTLHVEAAPGEHLNPVNVTQTPATQVATPLVPEDIATIHTSPLVSQPEVDSISFVLWMMIVGSPSLFILLVIFRKLRDRRQSKPEYYLSVAAFKSFSKTLSNCRTEDVLLNALRDYVGDRLALNGRGLTADDIAHLLREKNVPHQDVEGIKALLLALESSRYAGVASPSSFKEWKEKSQTLIGRIDKKLGVLKK